MSARFLRNNRVLSYGERERIKRAIDADRRRLLGKTDGIPDRFQRYIDNNVKEDPKILQRNITKLEKVLSNGSPDSLSKHERLAKEKMLSQDREWLQKNMVPRTSHNIGWRDIKEGRATQANYDKAVQGCLKEMSPEFQKRANRYKNNMRELDPDNPNASNLENIRPETT